MKVEVTVVVSSGHKEVRDVVVDASELLPGRMPATENNAVEVVASNGGSRWWF